MSKTYTVTLADEYTVGGKIGVPVTIDGNHTAWICTGIELTPYTEPDTNEAYQRGVEDGAKSVENWNVQEKKLRMDEAYQKGLSDAWDAARKIVLSREDGGLFGYEERKAVFGCGNYMALKMFLAPEAIEKIRQYEQEQEKIKAGNEVNGEGGRGTITKISDDGDHFNVMWENGSTGYYMMEDFKKTGRHFPEIAEVLRKMQEEKE